MSLLTNHLSPKLTTWQGAISAVVILLVTMFFSIRDARVGLHAPVFESKKLAQEVGEIVHHSNRLFYVARHYGVSLEYFGELSGASWLRAIAYLLYRHPGEQELSIKERLDALSFVPEYFVTTDFDQLRRNHTDLRSYLECNWTLVAESEKYLIYEA